MARVQSDTDDETARAVLQDWLLTNGDPRGQLAEASNEDQLALLRLHGPNGSGERCKPSLIETIAAAKPLALRSLSCRGEAPYCEYQEDYDDLCSSHTPDCSALWAAAPALRRVSLWGNRIALGEIARERLQYLTLESVDMPANVPHALPDTAVETIRQRQADGERTSAVGDYS